MGSSVCDVLVVGAGPAGSAAACALARAGLDVILTDQQAFPRDKLCGDGLISDALGALTTLGIRPLVEREAVIATELRMYAPSGEHVALAGAFACLPRARFDAMLLDAAVDAGAMFVPSLTALYPVEESGVVAGARFRGATGEPIDIRARVTLLATGANASVLAQFGFEVPMKPMAVAGRAYYEAPPEVAAAHPHLAIVYHREWCPGYGWIFPSPGGRFNIGVGIFPGRAPRGTLREFWDFFRRRFPPAAAIVDASRPLSEFRGAPLRTGLTAARFGSPGLLVVGEAMATTYPATGEGIGKAMESGLLAARYAQDVLAGRCSPERVASAYGAEFRRRYDGRYRAYATAQRYASHPHILNLLTLRANAGRFVRQELEALVDERGDARKLFSVSGLLTALVR